MLFSSFCSVSIEGATVFFIAITNTISNFIAEKKNKLKLNSILDTAILHLENLVKLLFCERSCYPNGIRFGVLKVSRAALILVYALFIRERHPIKGGLNSKKYGYCYKTKKFINCVLIILYYFC